MTSPNLLILPVLGPILLGVVALATPDAFRFRSVLCLLGALLIAAVGAGLLALRQGGETLVLTLGGWDPPFAITLMGDTFSALMITVTGVVALAVSIYTLATSSDELAPSYSGLFLIMLGGVVGAFLTTDLFNLYVWFEVILLSSFILLVCGRDVRWPRGAFKYIVLNVFSSIIFLSGLGLLYANAGTLNISELNGLAPELLDQAGFLAAVLLLLTSFAIKGGLFPLYFWLPASYHLAHPAVSAIFGGLLTKVGMYAMFRLVLSLELHTLPIFSPVLVGVAVLTMLFGVIGAAAQLEVRRILSFHIISQVGYIALGLALGARLGVAAGIFYTVHHIVAKTNLFLVGGILERLRGTGDLRSIGDLFPARPILCIAFLIPAGALAGIPPLSGFFAKLTIFHAAVDSGAYLSLMVAALVSLVTIYSMGKIWSEGFWSPNSSSNKVLTAIHGVEYLGVGLLCTVTIGVGVFFDEIYALAETASIEMLGNTNEEHDAF